MQLYPWQAACLERWEENGFMGIVHVITGAGKTVAALAATEKLETKLKEEQQRLRVFVVVPTTVLANQWYQSMKDFFSASPGDHKVGLYYGTRKDKEDQFCTIYVVNSARFSLSARIIEAMQKGDHILLIADECHHYGSDENRKIFAFMNSPKFQRRLYSAMGLSATPQSAHFSDVLVPALGVEIYQYGVSEAIEAKHITPYVVFSISVSLTGDELEQYGELTLMLMLLQTKLMSAYPELKSLSRAMMMIRLRQLAAELDDENSLPQKYLNTLYLRRDLVTMAENRAACAVELVRKLGRHERMILFCEKIRQAELIYRQLRKHYPSQIGIYHSEMHGDMRARVLRDFRDGVIRILVACKALDEGMDVPDATTGIVVSSTLTSRQRIQRLGRVLRKASGKELASLYYLYIPSVMEDSAYLPEQDSAESYLMELKYYHEEHDFDCDFYASVALSVLRKASDQGLGGAQLSELRACMSEGLVRADWLMSEERLKAHIQEATKQHEKNYWTTMRQMSKVRESENWTGFSVAEDPDAAKLLGFHSHRPVMMEDEDAYEEDWEAPMEDEDDAWDEVEDAWEDEDDEPNQPNDDMIPITFMGGAEEN